MSSFFKKWLLRVTVGFVALILGLYLIFSLGLYGLSKLARASDHSLKSTKVVSTVPHLIQLLDTGYGSMRARLELIASAKATIEMEFFIFDLDPAGRILLNALIKQAEKGVQVRLLVDFSKPIFRLGPAYA